MSKKENTQTTKNERKKKEEKTKKKRTAARAFAGISTGKMPILGLKDCCEYVY